MASVDPGKEIHYEFSLSRGMTLVAEFQVRGGLNNRVNVWLLDLANFQRYSAGQRFSFYRGTSGTVQDVAKYRFLIPQTDVYHLVLDNRRSVVFARNVRAYVYALSPTPTKSSLAAERGLQELLRGLKQLFVFPDFRISIRHCGLVNAFSDPNITLCTELFEHLEDQGLREAVLFVLFHELGHSLLHTWGYPFADNEDVADEFATVILMMGKQQAAALAAARWWASRPSEGEAKAKLWVDDRHTLSPQRARNIIRWLNQEGPLLRKWQKILVPNMQTEALKALYREQADWVDGDLVRKELGQR